MKTSKLIATCCVVTALWTEIQCMDDTDEAKLDKLQQGLAQTTRNYREHSSSDLCKHPDCNRCNNYQSSMTSYEGSIAELKEKIEEEKRGSAQNNLSMKNGDDLEFITKGVANTKISTVNTSAPFIPTVNTSAPFIPTVNTSTPFIPTVNTSTPFIPTVNTSTPFIPTVNELGISRQQCLSALYFSESALLKSSSVAINENNIHNHLKDMNDFLIEEVKSDKHNGWSSNHITADLFVTVNDTRADKIRCIKGSLLAEKITGDNNCVFYDFSVSPDNKNITGKTFADFTASDVNGMVLQCVQSRQYIPIIQRDLRPIFDQNNHGDRLVVDTVSTNIDLFFSLIRKSSHRSDLKILSMGINYYSSYDACNNCFEKLYNLRQNICWKLVHYAATNGYNYEANFPFHTVFHSSKPYQKTSYVLTPKGTNSIYPVTETKSIYAQTYTDYSPRFSFSLNISQTPQENMFRYSNNFSFDLLHGEVNLNPNFLYFSVSDFENEKRKATLNLK